MRNNNYVSLVEEANNSRKNLLVMMIKQVAANNELFLSLPRSFFEENELVEPGVVDLEKLFGLNPQAIENNSILSANIDKWMHMEDIYKKIKDLTAQLNAQLLKLQTALDRVSTAGKDSKQYRQNLTIQFNKTKEILNHLKTTPNLHHVKARGDI